MATPQIIGYPRDPMDAPFRRALAPITAIAVLLSAAWWGYTFLSAKEARIDANGRVGHVFDDAYMFVRYADHVLGGWGVAWNAGEGPVHGNTSALYLLEIVGVRAAFHGDPGHAALIGSMLGAILAIAAIVWMLASVGRLAGSTAPSWAWMLAIPAVLGPDVFRYHAITGMDTTLAVAAVAGTAAAGSRAANGSDRAAILAGVLGWLAIEARPDAGLLALGLPCLLCGSAGRWRAGATAAAITIAASAVSVLGKWAYYGDPLPLASYVKRSGFYDGYVAGWRWNPVEYLLEIGLWTMPFWLAWLLGFRRERWPLYAALLLPTLATWATFFGVVQIMGFHARYYVPASVGVMALGAVGAVDLVRTRRPTWLGAIPAAALGLAALWPAPFAKAYERAALTRADARPERYATADPLPFRRINPSTQAIVRILRKTPVRLGATEYGLIGATLPDVPILDLSGLHDPALAHGGFSMDRVLDVAPPLVWMPFPDYDGMTREMYCDPRFWRAYDVYPGAFRFGVAVRRDSPAVKAAVAEEFAAFYPGDRLDAHAGAPRPQGCE